MTVTTCFPAAPGAHTGIWSEQRVIVFEASNTLADIRKKNFRRGPTTCLMSIRHDTPLHTYIFR